MIIKVVVFSLLRHENVSAGICTLGDQSAFYPCLLYKIKEVGCIDYIWSVQHPLEKGIPWGLLLLALCSVVGVIGKQLLRDLLYSEMT